MKYNLNNICNCCGQLIYDPTGIELTITHKRILELLLKENLSVKEIEEKIYNNRIVGSNTIAVNISKLNKIIQNSKMFIRQSNRKYKIERR